MLSLEHLSWGIVVQLSVAAMAGKCGVCHYELTLTLTLNRIHLRSSRRYYIRQQHSTEAAKFLVRSIQFGAL